MIRRLLCWLTVHDLYSYSWLNDCEVVRCRHCGLMASVDHETSDVRILGRGT